METLPTTSMTNEQRKAVIKLLKKEMGESAQLGPPNLNKYEGKDTKLDDFDIICQKCGSTDCRTFRDFYPEMRGECKVICLDCDNTEFCVEEKEA